MNGEARAVSIYTTQFWLLCTSSFLFFASFNMIVPELPAYLTRLGGEDYKGLIISLFTVTALISRPFSGKLTDRIGRVPVMMFGSGVCFLISLLYPVLSSVWGFLLLRFVHGFSTGFTPTGQTTYLTDIVPAERRGEAVGVLGTAGSLGMATGPALGDVIVKLFSLNLLFYCASFFGLMSIVVLTGIRETLPASRRFSPSMLRVEWHDLFDRRVWAPCLVMFLTVLGYGTMLTVIPDFAEFVGADKGLVLAFFPVASLMARLVGGRASDRYGRKNVLRMSTVVIVLAMIVIGMGTAPVHLMVGMSLYGLGHGLTTPTLFAWATDLSDPQRKGRGLASLYILMELGIGVGALVSGLVFDNDPSNFFITFFICAAFATLAFVFLALWRRRRV